MLSQDQSQFYAQNGYLVVPDVFSTAEITELNQVTDEFLAGACKVTLSDNVYDLAPDHTTNAPKVRRIKDPTTQHAAYDQAMRHPRLLDIVKALLGPAVRFDHAKLNFKPVGGGAAVEWHQDWAFYPHTNDDILAVGLYLEDCQEANGPLMVIPGSHLGPVFDHHDDGYFVGACDPAELGDKLDNAVPLVGKAGSITIHHVRTAHASCENRADRMRRLLLFSYAAFDAWPIVPVTTLDDFNSRIICGEPTFALRQTAVPVRLPLPRRQGTDSIFDDQAAVAGRSFAAADT